MGHSEESVLQRLAAEAARAGADALEVEYKDGHEEVVAFRGRLGQEIARLPSSGPDAASLLGELNAIGRRKESMTLDDHRYELRCHAYESFGEKAYRVELRRTV